MANIGHGHVWPRDDGMKARCGGPGVCVECGKDAATKAASQVKPRPAVTKPEEV